ncbi:MAG TPA: heavy-metal-associated domain-containing protein [Flavobacteriales bacterium]|nr:heavy-metal-associated domain-containing protein [Flavobacteriales bacterium]
MKHILSILLAICTLGAFAQSTSTSPDGKSASIAIQSTAICDMCEKTIETELVYTKGVKKVDVDLTTAAVNVIYDPRKTDADKLRAALTKLGYSADGTPGDAAAFAKLPQCCQNEGCGKLPVKQ